MAFIIPCRQTYPETNYPAFTVLKDRSEKHVRDLRKFVNDQMNKLNAEKKEKISSIQNNRQKLLEEIEKIRETIQNTNNKILTLPQDKLVTKRTEISDTLFQLTTTPVSK